MRTFLIAALGLLVCCPAFAQTRVNPQSSEDTSAAQSNDAQQATTKIAEQIKRNLEQAGFKNITLVPSAFIVRAEDQNGNPVMMMVNPGSITAVSEMNGTASDSNDHSTVGQGGGQAPGASPNSDNPNASQRR
jgi:hypothetical protein